jgi:hypothetical protein
MATAACGKSAAIADFSEGRADAARHARARNGRAGVMFLVVICTGDRREYRMDRSFGLAFQALNRMEKRTLALLGLACQELADFVL